MSIKVDEEYYVKLPNHELYVEELSSLYLKFACFFDNANPFTESEARKIAERYSLQVVERTVTTTTEIKSKIIYKGEIKNGK